MTYDPNSSAQSNLRNLSQSLLEAGWALYTHVFHAVWRHVHAILAVECLAAIIFSMWHHQPSRIAAVGAVGFVTSILVWYHRPKSST